MRRKQIFFLRFTQHKGKKRGEKKEREECGDVVLEQDEKGTKPMNVGKNGRETRAGGGKKIEEDGAQKKEWKKFFLQPQCHWQTLSHFVFCRPCFSYGSSFFWHYAFFVLRTCVFVLCCLFL